MISLRIALIADAYPPLRSSAAVQIRDLSLAFAKAGHDLTVFIPYPELKESFDIETQSGVTIVKIKALKTKDIGYLGRVFAEFMMPYLMMLNLRYSNIKLDGFDGVVWYSPTIFLAPFVHVLKLRSGCKAYLIIRDIFPEWALDMGLMRIGISYYFLKLIAYYQYSVADVIGVQTKGNEFYFSTWRNKINRRLEVLQNWLSSTANVGCSINISTTKLANRKVFVYAGNMGVAQGVDVLIDLAESMNELDSVGFIIVGRGSEVQRIKEDSVRRDLKNILFYDEIDPTEIPGLYAQCHIGLVLLDSRHKTHNIPGKFLSYMRAGLPVLAKVNQGNDLVELINRYKVGQTFTQGSISELSELAEALMNEVDLDLSISIRCKELADKMFSSEVAVKQIVNALI